MGVTKAAAPELSAVEAARQAGVRLDVIYPMMRAGRIEGRKVDGQWRISATSLAAHIAKRQKHSSK